jgi:hypothetical protein
LTHRLEGAINQPAVHSVALAYWAFVGRFGWESEIMRWSHERVPEAVVATANAAWKITGGLD